MYLQNKKLNVFYLILAVFVIWRLFLFIPVIVGQNLLQFRNGYPYARLLFYSTDKKNLVNNFLISPWANFDGVAYLSIAGNGYYKANARFFPLYPAVVGFADKATWESKPFVLKQVAIAFLLSNIFFFFSLLLFYKLVRMDFCKKIALTSIVFILVFPTSFFFGSVYTESLFFLLSLASFYFARKKMWILASISGILLSATRIVGVFILPALLWEFFASHHPGKFAGRTQNLSFQQKGLPAVRQGFGISFSRQNDMLSLTSLLLSPLGLIAFMLFNYNQWKDPLLFLHQQGQVLNGRSATSMVFIPQTFFRYLKIILTVSPAIHFEWWIALLELFSVLFAGVLLFIAWIKKIRFSYILFSLLCFLPPILSGTFTGLPRYILILFPMFIALSLIKGKAIKIAYVVISLALLFLCLMFFSKGYLIA